jgi:hypothetical protein
LAETSLSDDEKKVIEYKYASPKISEMSPQELQAWGKALALKIHVITGWSIPNHEALLNILQDQLMKSFQEKFSDLNPDEIEYAFRSRTDVQDWGKQMNLQLIDSVLMPYLNERYRISDQERQINYFKRKREFDFHNDINWRGLIEEDYQRFLHNKRFKFIAPEHYYQVLEDDLFYPKSWYEERLELYKKRWPEIDVRSLFDVARQRCVLQLFRAGRKSGIKNLYTYQPEPKE